MASASGQQWPQALKDFANRTFAACTDANRKQVSEELRTLIFKCYKEGTIDSTDWDKVELEGLKKQKAKKRGLTSDILLDDDDKREKRARRFEREQAEANAAAASGAYYQPPPGAGMGSLAGRLGAAMIDPSSSSPSASSVSSFSSSTGFNHNANRWGANSNGKQQKGNKSGALSKVRQTWASSNAHGFADSDVADPNVIDWDVDTVVGLSTKLEKPYLRLTSAPDPRTVRPLPVLLQTLELLKDKWRKEQNYTYICDQFKSMRQDLTVQRIKNDFTVKVYEIHARIALEKGDLGEYNQCQSQLRGLYALGLPGCAMEFLAYRILYLLHTRNRRDVNALMSELTPANKAEAAVSHALGVRSALATGNYHAFFQLYLKAPNMNAWIMDHFIERERIAALKVMAKCYRPSLALSYITSELAFADAKEAHEFLAKHKAAVYLDPTPAAAAAAAPTTKRKGGQPPSVPYEGRLWDAKNALLPLVEASGKYSRVDIKGQI